MSIDLFYDEYRQKLDDDLSVVAQKDYNLTQAVLEKDPYLAQEVKYRLFDKDWMKMYWKNIVADVKGIDISEVVTVVLVEETIKEFTIELMKFYQLPELTTSGALALTILIFRAAQKSGKSKEK